MAIENTTPSPSPKDKVSMTPPSPPRNAEKALQAVQASRLQTTTTVVMALLSVLVIISSGLNTWALTTIVDVKSDVAGMKGTQYTSIDALADEKAEAIQILAMWKEIAKIQVTIAAQPVADPPEWLVQKVVTLELWMAQIESNK